MISVSHLSKRFRVAQPGRGLGGKVKRPFAPPASRGTAGLRVMSPNPISAPSDRRTVQLS
jgi:hypothetical protein